MPAIGAPIIGMNEVTKATTASGIVSGTPSTASPLPIASASKAATAAVPRTYPPSVVTTRSPIRRARAYWSPVNGRSRNSHSAGPSLRKKNRMTAVSTAPVTKFVTAEMPAIAPAPNRALVTKSTTPDTASSICPSVTRTGSSCRRSCSCCNPSTADACSIGH